MTRHADDFAESIGANVHLSYFPSNYRELDPVTGSNDQWPRVTEALTRLGIRYIRDHVPHDPAVTAQLIMMARDHGIRSSVIVPPTGAFPFAQTLATLRELATAGALASVEGPNEPDNPPQAFDPAPTRELQAQLYAAMKADSALAPVPLLTPPLICEEGHKLLGDLSGYADQGNIHPYAVASPFEPRLLQQYVDWAALVSGDLAVQATETGYCTPLTPADHFGAWSGVSARAAGSYLPKTLLTTFASGVVRTYVYELLDEMLVNGVTGSSHDLAFAEQLQEPRYHQGRFGLLEHDFTPKPAARALCNLLALTAGGRREAELDPLGYHVDHADVRSLSLQRADGDHLLALWRDVELYVPELDGETRRVPHELYPAGLPVQVRFDSARDIRIHHLGVSPQPVARLAADRLDLVVPPDDVLVLRLGPIP